MMNEQPYIHEASMLVKYLTGRPASPQVALLYAAAVQKTRFNEDARHRRIWQWCLQHPWSLKYLDAALAWPQRYHILRKRIYIMLAILETQASYSDRFLPRPRSPWYAIVILFSVMRAFINMIAGKILLWFI